MKLISLCKTANGIVLTEDSCDILCMRFHLVMGILGTELHNAKMHFSDCGFTLLKSKFHHIV